MNNLRQASQEFYREVLEHYLPDNVHGVRTVEFSGVNQSSVIPALRGCEVEPAALADAVHELHPDQLEVDIRGNRQQEPS